MTRREFATARAIEPPSTDGRRRQLRLMILSAADTARQSRMASAVQFAERVSQHGRAIRDRVSTLLRAAG